MSESIAFISPESTPEKIATIASIAAASKKAKPKPRNDAEKYTDRARQLVVDNYNAHHDSSKTPALTMDLVYVVWFAKALDNWKAIVASSVAKGLLYEVTYNGAKSEAYVDVYKKINNVRIAD